MSGENKKYHENQANTKMARKLPYGSGRHLSGDFNAQTF